MDIKTINELSLILTDLAKYAESLETHINMVCLKDDIDLLRVPSYRNRPLYAFYPQEMSKESQHEAEIMLNDLSGYIESLEEDIRSAKENNDISGYLIPTHKKSLCSFCPCVRSLCYIHGAPIENCVEEILVHLSEAEDKTE